MKPLSPKERAKDLRLRREFHLTLADYKVIFKFQNGCCAICKQPRSRFKNDFAVDHDHKTGLVRGLLCMACNRALGKFRDSTDLVREAYHYVSNPPATSALARAHITAIGRVGTKVRAKLLAAIGKEPIGRKKK